jgi:hypothetical protein
VGGDRREPDSREEGHQQPDSDQAELGQGLERQ